VFRLEDERWVVAATREGSAAVRVEPFDAVEIDMARWWPDTAAAAGV